MFIPFSGITVPRGITSVIGSGGKTSLLYYLSRHLAGTVVLTTSTHMFPFPDLPLLDTSSLPAGADPAALAAGMLRKHRVLAAGSLSRETGKLKAPSLSPQLLSALADYVIVEADGSKGLPLKAHRPSEPVIWPQSALTICVAGAAGLGKPAGEVCHCPGLFCRLSGITPAEPILPEHIAQVLNTEDLADVYFVNQTDLLPDPAPAYALCRHIKKPAAAGSLQSRRFLSMSSDSARES